jgi:hypothetical protein
MYKLNRDEYRKIKNMSKEELERWLERRNTLTYESLRRVFEKEYQDEVDNTINNFLIAIVYTLVFTEEIHLEKGAAAGVIEDLLATVDMFKSGEYKPEDYEKELKEAGITFQPYDYKKVYRKRAEKLSSAIGEMKVKIFDMQNPTKDDMLDVLNDLDNLNGGDLL